MAPQAPPLRAAPGPRATRIYPACEKERWRRVMLCLVVAAECPSFITKADETEAALRRLRIGVWGSLAVPHGVPVWLGRATSTDGPARRPGSTSAMQLQVACRHCLPRRQWLDAAMRTDAPLHAVHCGVRRCGAVRGCRSGSPWRCPLSAAIQSAALQAGAPTCAVPWLACMCSAVGFWCCCVQWC